MGLIRVYEGEIPDALISEGHLLKLVDRMRDDDWNCGQAPMGGWVCVNRAGEVRVYGYVGTVEVDDEEGK